MQPIKEKISSKISTHMATVKGRRNKIDWLKTESIGKYGHYVKTKAIAIERCKLKRQKRLLNQALANKQAL